MEDITYGRLHSMETMGLVDGPGSRTIFFLQGCPLRCQFCHNPDTQPVQGGDKVSAQDILDRAERYRTYHGQEGGVTFSGGEPMLQGRFLYEALRLLKENGINTALDTSGIGSSRDYSKVLPLVDTLLLDVKAFDEESYWEICKGSFETYMKFLTNIENYGFSGQIWIRHVMLPGYTDDKESMRKLVDIIEPVMTMVDRIEILPYHTQGVHKYEELGLDYELEGLPPMDKGKAKNLEIYANKLFARRIAEERSKDRKEKMEEIKNIRNPVVNIKERERLMDIAKDLSIFNGLSDEERDQLLDHSELLDFKTDQFVFKEGTPADYMFVILEGQVKIYQETIDGRDIIMYIFGAKDYVGGLNLLGDKDYLYNCQALTDSKILAIGEKDFDKFLRENPSALQNMLKHSLSRIRWAEDQIQRLSTSNNSMRTAGILLRLKNSLGVETEDGILLELNVNRQELGATAGLNSDTVSRKLGEFEELGYIELVGSNDILIKDLEALEDYVF